MTHYALTSLASVLAAIALTACGGGGSGGPTEHPTVASIQLFGDSTQWLAGPDWQARYPGVVDNEAVPGTSTAQLLSGTDGRHTAAWPSPVSAQLVVIKFGANDCLPWFNTSVAQFKANLMSLIAGAGAAHAMVVLETPDPTMDANRPDEPAYTQAVREVAAATGTLLIDTDACWRARPGGWADLIGADNEHANEAGRQFTVDTCVAPVIDAWIKVVDRKV